MATVADRPPRSAPSGMQQRRGGGGTGEGEELARAALRTDTAITEEPVQKEKDGPTPGLGGFKNVLLGNRPLASFLLFIPFGILSYHAKWAESMVFLCNFFAILPMAWLIGKSTEDLAEHTGEAVGGLLNATFGNVVEMLLCINGIRHNQLAVVQCTLVGSILSNLLLVLGTSFIWGGYKHPPTQKYSQIGAGAQSSLLLLAVLSILLPTMYSVLVAGEQAILDISRGVSILLLVIYLQYLIFSLYTHKHLFEDADDADDGKAKADAGSSNAAIEDDDDEDGADMDMTMSTIVLAVCTVLTSFCSEYLISSIEGTIDAWGISKEFIGVVILPIIGNAAEHYTAIIVAGRNKMDLSLGVAVGSSCQMALLVTPFTVMVGWIMGKDMSLNFHPFQVSVLLLAVLIVANVLKDGESNWLEGSMLCTAYMSIAMIYYFEAHPSSTAYLG